MTSNPPPRSAQLQARIWKGAKLGALLGGVLGFAAGMCICIALKLPIPPLFVTELALILGAALGAGLAWASASPVGRRTLLGAWTGALAGVPIVLLENLVRGAWDPLPWLACLLLGTFLGHQRALSPHATCSADPWRLHRQE